MKVTVNKCPHTGRLIEDDKEYQRHMREIRKRIKRDAWRVAFADQFQDFLAPLYQLKSFDEVAEWLSENYWTYARFTGYRNERWYSNKNAYIHPDPEDKVKIEFSYPKFSEKISTSRGHWGRAPFGQEMAYGSLPRDAYPEYGWEGRVRITFEGNGYNFFESTHLQAVGIHTGSGGGGPAQLSYDMVMFAKDFRGLGGMEALSKLARV